MYEHDIRSKIIIVQPCKHLIFVFIEKLSFCCFTFYRGPEEIEMKVCSELNEDLQHIPDTNCKLKGFLALINVLMPTPTCRVNEDRDIWDNGKDTKIANDLFRRSGNQN